MAETDGEPTEDYEASGEPLVESPEPQGIPEINKEVHDSTRGEKVIKFLTGVTFNVYASHALSSWGDRMWMFAVGFYLNDLSPESLRLVAAYGFSMGAMALLMGAIIGDLVDRYPRLIVARTSLICQNISVAVCAAIVCVIYSYKQFIYSVYWRSALCEAAVIIVAIIASMFSMGSKISVQKDWIGVICERKSAKLARMSAIMRAIDLVTNLVSPVIAGAIMTAGSMFESAIFIAVWNIISVIIEYALLHRVYYKVPELAIKSQDDQEDAGVTEVGVNAKVLEVNGNVESCGLEEGPSNKDAQKPSPERITKKKASTAWYQKLCSSLIILAQGWRTYMSYDVKFAGMGLACLYMTVLGFDNITVGYGYGQGLNQFVMGMLFAAGAGVGVSATFTYPMLRRRYGIEKVGLMGFICEITVLVLCVASVWLPGSPFDLTKAESTAPTTINSTIYADKSTLFLNSTNMTTPSAGEENAPSSYVSIVFLMAGIILARFGLWTADLSISQLLLERVKSSQRGVVNGVQGSLNMLMDMLKFVLVIAAPLPSQFGILTLISFLFICMGCGSYVIYARKVLSNAKQDVEYGDSSSSQVSQFDNLETVE